MKTLYTLLLVACSLTLNAQDFSREIQFRIAGDLGLSYTRSTLSVQETMMTYQEFGSSIVATNLFPIQLRYAFHPSFSVGFDYSFGKYLDASSNERNKINAYGVSLEFNAIQRSATRLYVGLCVGGNTLQFKETVDDIVKESEWSGMNIKMYTAVNHFFSDGRFGILGGLNFDTRVFELKSYSEDGVALDLSKVDGSLFSSGISLNGGFVYRFRL
jgi:hypothetical protein